MCSQQREDKVLLQYIYPYVFHNDYLVRQAACRAVPAVIPLSSMRDHLKIIVNDLLVGHQRLSRISTSVSTYTLVDDDNERKEKKENSVLWKLSQLELVNT